MHGKTVAMSRSVTSEMVLPHQANPMGNVHGGEIMKIMDNAGSVAAMRHCKLNVVTLRVDELIFHKPIFVGQLVTCRSHLVYVGNSSMEVQVVVEVEDLTREEPPQVALSAYFTFVALDEEGHPTPVPRLLLESEEERIAFEAGRRRAEMRKKAVR